MMHFLKKPFSCSLWKACFLSVFLFGLAAHGFIFLNPSFSHDSLIINQAADTEFQLAIGRFGQAGLRLLRGNITATWLLGLLSLVFLGLALWLMCDLLCLRSRGAVLLAAGMLTTNATVIFSNATYMPWCDVYMLSCLLASAAVWLTVKKPLGVLPGLVCAALSMSLYQSYITVACSLAVLWAVFSLLRGNSIRDTLKKLLLCAAAVAGGGVLYLLMSRWIQALLGVALSDNYNSLSGLSELSMNGLLYTGIRCYRSFFDTLLHGLPFHMRILLPSVLLWGLALLMLVQLLRKRAVRGLRLVLILLLVLLLPMACNGIIFLSPRVYHILMAYGCFMAFLLPAGLWEEYTPAPRKCPPLVPLLGAVLIFTQIVFANQAYTLKFTQEQATLSYMTRAVDRIEQTPGYVPGETPLVFMGEPNRGPLQPRFPGFEHMRGLFLDNRTFSVFGAPGYPLYLRQIMGYPYPDPSPEQQAAALASPEARMLEPFPAENCCVLTEGCLVIRFS